MKPDRKGQGRPSAWGNARNRDQVHTQRNVTPSGNDDAVDIVTEPTRREAEMNFRNRGSNNPDRCDKC